MTTRMEFDSYCLQKTIESGAVLQKVQHLWEIHEDAAGVTLTAGEGRFRGKFLIGADGASGQIGRLIRFTPAPKALAIEGRVYLKGAFQEMLLDFGVVDSGYGWVFPKKDHLSVGLYTMSEEVSLRRESLADYAHRRLGPCDLVDMVGHAIGLGGWKYRPSSQRVFLVGDAAGLAEALLGEGIYHAIISGQSAARAINQQLRTGESARRCFRKLLGPIQRAAWSEFRLARWFYGDLAFGYSLLTCPLTRYALTKGYALGWTHRAIRHYGWLLPFQKVLKLDEMLPA
jgi:flavin-dependent dehydrogenase